MERQLLPSPPKNSKYINIYLLIQILCTDFTFLLRDVTTSSSSSKPETEAQTSKEETATPGSPKPMTKE